MWDLTKHDLGLSVDYSIIKEFNSIHLLQPWPSHKNVKHVILYIGPTSFNNVVKIRGAFFAFHNDFYITLHQWKDDAMDFIGYMFKSILQFLHPKVCIYRTNLWTENVVHTKTSFLISTNDSMFNSKIVSLKSSREYINYIISANQDNSKNIATSRD